MFKLFNGREGICNKTDGNCEEYKIGYYSKNLRKNVQFLLNKNCSFVDGTCFSCEKGIHGNTGFTNLRNLY